MWDRRDRTSYVQYIDDSSFVSKAKKNKIIACTHNNPLQRFSIKYKQLIFHCSLPECLPDDLRPSTHSINDLIRQLERNSKEGYNSFQHVAELYSSWIRTLQQQKDLLMQKIKDKGCFLKQDQRELLQILKQTQNKTASELNEADLIFVTTIRLDYSRLMQNMQNNVQHEFEKASVGMQRYFQYLCTSMRTFWARDLDEGLPEYIKSRGRLGAKNFYDSIQSKNDMVFKNNQDRKLNMNQNLKNKKLENVIEITANNVQKSQFLKYYLPNIKNIVFGSYKDISNPWKRAQISDRNFARDINELKKYYKFRKGLTKASNQRSYQRNNLRQIETPETIRTYKQFQQFKQPKEFKVLKILSKNDQITALKINFPEISLNSDQEDEFLIVLCKNFKNLKELELCFFERNLATSSIELLSYQLVNLEKITFQIKHLNFKFKGFPKIRFNSLSEINGLKSLRLIGFYGETLSLTNFELLQSLQEIEISNCYQIYLLTLQKINNLPNLKVFKMHDHDCQIEQKFDLQQTNFNEYNQQQPVSLSFIIWAFANNKNLQQLNLNNVDSLQHKIQEVNVTHLISMPKLQKLFTNNIFFRFDQMRQICKKANLKLLDFANKNRASVFQFGIKRDQIPNQEAFLKSLRHIVELRLDGHKIINKGAMTIARECKEVKTLSLYECGISDSGCLYLSKLPLLQAIFLGVDDQSVFNNGARPFKILLNSPKIKQLKVRNMKSRFFLVHKKVRNQNLLVEPTIINLKPFGAKSEFKNIAEVMRIPLTQNDEPILQPILERGTLRAYQPYKILKIVFNPTENRYSFTNQNQFEFESRKG